MIDVPIAEELNLIKSVSVTPVIFLRVLHLKHRALNVICKRSGRKVDVSVIASAEQVELPVIKALLSDPRLQR